jgi:flavin-dependent dehydrogenase
MTGNGILFVGDSACQPNPIHGGGIGPSLLSGKLAAETLNSAFEREDFSRESLWMYNRAYMTSYGAKTASLDVFRMFLESCSNIDLNHGMKNRLVHEDDILKASIGEDLQLSITDKARRAFKGIRRLSFLRVLIKTAQKMREVKQLYRTYPDPDGFVDWVRSVDHALKEFFTVVNY